MKSITTTHGYRVFRILCILLAIWMLYVLVSSYWSQFNYLSFGLSDWMINYEGGFVRRGLAGQFLLELYEVHPYSLRNAVAVIVIVSFVLLQWLLIRLFRNEGWSCTILFGPFMIYNVMTRFNMGQFAMRRDFFVLLMMWGVFYLYSKSRDKHFSLSFLAFQLLGVLILLIYEPSFFFTFPILLVNYYMHLLRKGKSKMLCVVMSLVYFSPFILTMVVLCLYNGTEDTATLIWNSWIPCMENYPTGSGLEMGAGVEFLTRGTADVMKFHLEKNFIGSFLLSHNLPSLPFTLGNIVIIYYLVTRLNTVDLKWNKISSYDVNKMSDVLLIQFVSLIPMFTVLSCDWGRNFPYWVVSSLVAYHYFKNDDMHVSIVRNVSTLLQGGMSWLKILQNPWMYLLILFSIPIPYCFRATLYDSIPMLIFVQLKELIVNLL